MKNGIDEGWALAVDSKITGTEDAHSDSAIDRIL